MSFKDINESNKRILYIATSHIIQAVFIIIKIKFLTNFFSISAYAQYAIILSSMSTSVALARGGVDFLLTKKLVRGQTRPDYLPGYLSRLVIVVGYVMFISLLFQAFLYFFFLTSIDKSVFLLLACFSYILINSSNIALLAIYKGLNEINIYAKGYLIGSVTNSIVQCLLVWHYGDSGILLIIIGSALAQLFVQCILFKRVSKKYNLKLIKNKKKLKISYLKSGTLIALAKSYTAGVGMMSQFLLIYSLNSLSQGITSAAYYLYTGLIGQASNLILIAVSGAFFPSLLRAMQKGTEDFRDQIFYQSKLINAVIFPLFFFLLVSQDYLILLISNKNYLLDSDFFTYMLCAAFLAASKQSFELSLYCHQSNKYFLTISTISNILIVAIPLCMFYFFGINGFGIGLLVHSILIYAIILNISSKIYKYPLLNLDTLFILMNISVFLLISLNLDLLHNSIILLVLILSILNSVYELFFSRKEAN